VKVSFSMLFIKNASVLAEFYIPKTVFENQRTVPHAYALCVIPACTFYDNVHCSLISYHYVNKNEFKVSF